jgi:hypothetical protein
MKLFIVSILWLFIPVDQCSRAVIAQSVQRLGYGLDDRGSRVRFPAGAENFSLHYRVQNGSEAQLASFPVGTGGSFPGVKRPGREVDHSPPSIIIYRLGVALLPLFALDGC